LQAAASVEAARARIVSAEAAEQTAVANEDIAKLNLSYTHIYAPVTGRISSREVTDGNLITGGTPSATLLTTIVSLNPIHAVFDADEQSFLKYRRLAQEGKRASSRDVKNPIFLALADEKQGYPHAGHMDFVDNRFDPETGTMRGRAVIPNADLSLAPGLFVRIRLPGSARYEAVLIPDRAVATDQAQKFVFVVQADDTLKRQNITLGPISKGLRVVRQGLDGSERIVVEGLQRARANEKVTPQETKIEMIDDGLPVNYEPVPEPDWLLPRRSKQNGNNGKKPEAESPPIPSAAEAPQ
jgi:RND family efflux transporter MFP subunit